MIRDLRMNKIVVFFFAILLFLGTNCYFVWRSSLLHNIQILWIILTLYFLFSNPKFIDRKNILLSFFFCIAFFVYSLKISENFTAVIYYLFFPLTLLIPLSCRKDIMCFFLNSLFPILLLVSIIPYILVGLNLIHLPSFWIPPINSIKDYGYMNYLFFLSPDNTDVLSRFHSFYDEPGVIGSLSALILFLFFDILNKKSKIVYLLAGVLSFSFFFM